MKFDLVITNDDGQQATISGAFDFQHPAPQIAALDPVAGPIAGGTTVTIQGTGFRPGATVTFGGRPATVQSVTPTEIVCVTPSML
jgi:hypothetical protein